ncbi:RNA-directed DNA methylation 4, putative isoform 4 [Hibiscus syriacus]|uniref:RNA-directed DNA methylation 4, putative isoform 4 n=1 Tax=Hibiscus syriacus TaxID=106335 RepID=A0A6A3C1A1_HIBSY|nr:RNA-directed DNA methylation 4, putative isoform 4 [Hibiscus syriacus]
MSAVRRRRKIEKASPFDAFFNPGYVSGLRFAWKHLKVRRSTKVLCILFFYLASGFLNGSASLVVILVLVDMLFCGGLVIFLWFCCCDLCSLLMVFWDCAVWVPLMRNVFPMITGSVVGRGFRDGSVSISSVGNLGHRCVVAFRLLIAFLDLSYAVGKRFLATKARLTQITLLDLSYATNDVPLELSVIELEGLWQIALLDLSYAANDGLMLLVCTIPFNMKLIPGGPFVIKLSLELDILRREVEIQLKLALKLGSPFVVKLSLKWHDILHHRVEIVVLYVASGHEFLHHEVETMDDPFVVKFGLELDILLRGVEIYSRANCVVSSLILFAAKFKWTLNEIGNAPWDSAMIFAMSVLIILPGLLAPNKVSNDCISDLHSMRSSFQTKVPLESSIRSLSTCLVSGLARVSPSCSRNFRKDSPKTCRVRESVTVKEGLAPLNSPIEKRERGVSSPQRLRPSPESDEVPPPLPPLSVGECRPPAPENRKGVTFRRVFQPRIRIRASFCLEMPQSSYVLWCGYFLLCTPVVFSLGLLWPDDGNRGFVTLCLAMRGRLFPLWVLLVFWIPPSVVDLWWGIYTPTGAGQFPMITGSVVGRGFRDGSVPISSAGNLGDRCVVAFRLLRQELLSKSIQKQEENAKSARFEQIWRSRRDKNEAVDEMCHFYDVVRVDVEEKSNSMRFEKILGGSKAFVKLYAFKEFILEAVAEIESDMRAYVFGKEQYVYDYYTVKDDSDVDEDMASNPLPLVQVDDEDFYDLKIIQEMIILMKYPMRRKEEDEDEESKSSSSIKSSEVGSLGGYDEDLLNEIDSCDDDDDDYLGHGNSDNDNDGADWRWFYR